MHRTPHEPRKRSQQLDRLARRHWWPCMRALQSAAPCGPLAGACDAPKAAIGRTRHAPAFPSRRKKFAALPLLLATVR